MTPMAVIGKPFPTVRDELGSTKIHPEHHERWAVVYVRQSTAQQVLHHKESPRLQYGLTRRAEMLGWSADRIVVIDDDLGKSGASAVGRVGFQRLVSEVSLDHVGIILGIEMSRLARSCKDWHQLLEICALFRTLIADLDGIYDPSQYNDRLLLGLKGTMSEAELHILKQRHPKGTRQGRWNKARRGDPHWLAIQFMKTMKVDREAAALVLQSFGDASREWLDVFTMPTLVLIGSEDEDNGSARELAQRLPDATYAEVPGTHMSSVTRPELGETIAKFLVE